MNFCKAVVDTPVCQLGAGHTETLLIWLIGIPQPVQYPSHEAVTTHQLCLVVDGRINGRIAVVECLIPHIVTYLFGVIQDLADECTEGGVQDVIASFFPDSGTKPSMLIGIGRGFLHAVKADRLCAGGGANE